VASNQPMLPGMPRSRDIMTPEKRYPRGFTPERQKEVHEAFKDTVFHLRGLYDPNSDTHRVDGSLKLSDEGLVHHTNRHPALQGDDKELLHRLRGRVLNAIANSSIDMAELPPKGIRTVNLHKDAIYGTTNTAGVHELDADGHHIHLPVYSFLNKEERNRAESVLRHELGHAVTYLPSRRSYFDAGTEEGIADKYANDTAGKMHKGSDKPGLEPYAKKAFSTPTDAPDEEKLWSSGYLTAYPEVEQKRAVEDQKWKDISEKNKNRSKQKSFKINRKTNELMETD
jgi:hypothetical protein